IDCTPAPDDGFDTDVNCDKLDEHEENLNNLGKNMLLNRTQGYEKKVCEESLVRNEVVDNGKVPVKRIRKTFS
ncbi:hypothetical protein C0J52_12523, partial [Blattella germanica]